MYGITNFNVSHAKCGTFSIQLFCFLFSAAEVSKDDTASVKDAVQSSSSASPAEESKDVASPVNDISKDGKENLPEASKVEASSDSEESDNLQEESDNVEEDDFLENDSENPEEADEENEDMAEADEENEDMAEADEENEDMAEADEENEDMAEADDYDEDIAEADEDDDIAEADEGNFPQYRADSIPFPEALYLKVFHACLTDKFSSNQIKAPSSKLLFS